MAPNYTDSKTLSMTFENLENRILAYILVHLPVTFHDKAGGF